MNEICVFCNTRFFRKEDRTLVMFSHRKHLFGGPLVHNECFELFMEHIIGELPGSLLDDANEAFIAAFNCHDMHGQLFESPEELADLLILDMLPPKGSA